MMHLHPTAKVSEQVNRKCRIRNTILQLATPYTDPDSGVLKLSPLKFHNLHVWNSMLTVAIPDNGMKRYCTK